MEGGVQQVSPNILMESTIGMLCSPPASIPPCELLEFRAVRVVDFRSRVKMFRISGGS